MIWKRLNGHGKNWRHVYKVGVCVCVGGLPGRAADWEDSRRAGQLWFPGGAGILCLFSDGSKRGEFKNISPWFLSLWSQGRYYGGAELRLPQRLLLSRSTGSGTLGSCLWHAGLVAWRLVVGPHATWAEDGTCVSCVGWILIPCAIRRAPSLVNFEEGGGF